MTIQDIIERVDAERPHQFEEDTQILWLWQLDKRIWNEVVSQFYINTDLGKVIPDAPARYRDSNATLIASDEYMQMYIKYVEAMVDDAQLETARYANDMSSFNAIYDEFASNYSRTHEAITKQPRYTTMGRENALPFPFN